MTRRRYWGCKGRLRFRQPGLLLFAAAALLLWDGTGLIRLSLLCMLLHESGHVLAYILLRRRMPVLEFSCTGICLRLCGARFLPGQALLLAAAGPLASLFFCLGAQLWMRAGGWSYAGYWFSAVNFLQGAANLLPLPTLDGYRILCALRDGRAKNCIISENKVQ